MLEKYASLLNWALIPLLVITVAVTLILQLDKTSEEDELSKPPDHADYFIKDAKLSTLGLNGKLLYQVQAREILHFPDRSAEFTDLTLHYQGGAAGIWQLKAKKGILPAGDDNMELLGDVVILGQRPNEGITQMRMSDVKLLPEKGLMVTQSAVTITEPGSKITATGMEADILNDVISLSKDVQVNYAW